MGVTKEQVESTLISKLNPSYFEVVNTPVEILLSQFEEKRLLERNQLVNSALEEEMKQIHALSIKKASTPEQWKQQQEAEKSNASA